MSVNSPTSGTGHSADAVDTSAVQSAPSAAAIKLARRVYQSLMAVVCGRSPSKRGRSSQVARIQPLLWNSDAAFAEIATGEAQAARISRWHRLAIDCKRNETLEKLVQSVLPAIGSISNKTDLVSTDILETLAAVQTAPVWTLAEPAGESDWLSTCSAIAKLARAASGQYQLPLKSLGIELGITLCFVRNDAAAVDDDYLAEEFESLIEAHIDGDGFPDGTWLREFGFLAASWTRSFHLLRGLGLDFESQTALQFEWLMRQCLRLRRHDGRISFSSRPTSKSMSESFWMALAAISQDPDDAKLVSAASGRQGRSKPATAQAVAQANQLSVPANFSEWGRGAVLRSSWAPKSPKVAINFATINGQPRCNVEIGRNKDLIVGDSLPTWHVDQQTERLTTELEIICDSTDEDLDYLELQASTNRGRFNRQFLLSRTEEFLLITDSLTLNKTGHIRYQCEWPLGAAIEAMAESETREIYLNSIKPKSGRSKIQSLVLPLSLPEWKAQPFEGKLELAPNQLFMWQQRDGLAMSIPIVFDLNPSRSRRKRTWRKLTVAENRRQVSDDQAIAYRFQLGQQQWFFYRALASTGNRTFLGENTIAEFVFNRFEKQGTGAVTQLIEIAG